MWPNVKSGAISFKLFVRTWIEFGTSRFTKLGAEKWPKPFHHMSEVRSKYDSKIEKWNEYANALITTTTEWKKYCKIPLENRSVRDNNDKFSWVIFGQTYTHLANSLQWACIPLHPLWPRRRTMNDNKRLWQLFGSVSIYVSHHRIATWLPIVHAMKITLQVDQMTQ